MLNIVYSSFPFGDGESFVEYEIPRLNDISEKQYRIFSLYKGKEKQIKRKVDICGEVFTIEPSMPDYIKGLFSFFSPRVWKEFTPLKNRLCRDSLSRCLWRMLYYRAYGYALLKKAGKIGISENDVFVSYWLNECAYAAIMLKKRYKGIKIVSRAHGFDVFAERCYLPFRNELFEKIDCVYPINNVEKQYILDRYSDVISDERIRVCHLGIDLPDRYSPNADRSHFTIVTCSSIIQLKRLDLMIDALSEIHEFRFKWLHIGGGPLEKQIKEYAAKKLCAPNQSFEFIGQIPLPEVHRIYRENEAALFVNCSDTEGVPVSIMEAMSYGIPTAARDVGGNSEIVDNTNGVLLKSNCTAHDLADAIRNVYYFDNSEYTKMRRAAREKVEREFNADIQYCSMFKEVMKPHADRSL